MRMKFKSQAKVTTRLVLEVVQRPLPERNVLRAWRTDVVRGAQRLALLSELLCTRELKELER